MTVQLDFLKFFLQAAEEAIEYWACSIEDTKSDPGEENLAKLREAAEQLAKSSAEVGLLHWSEFSTRVLELVDAMLSHQVPCDLHEIELLEECSGIWMCWLGLIQQDPEIEFDTSDLDARICSLRGQSDCAPTLEEAQATPQEEAPDTPQEEAPSAPSSHSSSDPAPVSQQSVNTEFLPFFLQEAEETIESWSGALEEARSAPSDEILNDLFRFAHNMKGSAKSVGLELLGTFIHRVEDYVTCLRDKSLEFDLHSVELLEECSAVWMCWVGLLQTDPQTVLDVGELNEKLAASSGVKTPSSQIQTNESSPSPEIPSGRVEPQAGEIIFADELGKIEPSDQERKPAVEEAPSQASASGEELNPQVSEVPFLFETHHQGNSKRLSSEVSEETIRVPRTRIESLVGLVTELSFQLESYIEKFETESEETREVVQSIRGIMRSVQESSYGIVMSPLDPIYAWLERVALDVARKLKKSLRVEFRGGTVELDKRVIEKIKDPLMHIVRNAIDHGLDDHAERIAAGKDPVGRITISAEQTTTGVWLRISDDGRGMNPARILEKARSQGLATEGVNYTDSEIYNFVTLPGFSTAQSVTDISGRGVGLDVVKNTIERLSGEMVITSSLGQGTTFGLYFPAQITILSALLVQERGSQYAIPMSEVEAVVPHQEIRLARNAVCGPSFVYQNQTLPFSGLHDTLEGGGGLSLESGQDALSDRSRKSALVVRTAGGIRHALGVDEILGERSVVARQPSGVYGELKEVGGLTLLSDGLPALIINTHALQLGTEAEGG